MSAEGTRVPLLVGPVACIGCAPAPAPVWSGPALKEETFYQYTMAGGPGVTSNQKAWRRPTLARSANRVILDPCIGEMHIRQLAASSLGVAGLFIWLQKVAVEVEATPARVLNGWCGTPPPPAASPPGRNSDKESEADDE